LLVRLAFVENSADQHIQHHDHHIVYLREGGGKEGRVGGEKRRRVRSRQEERKEKWKDVHTALMTPNANDGPATN